MCDKKTVFEVGDRVYDMVYRVGQRFEVMRINMYGEITPIGKYILAQLDSNKVNLISLHSGNRLGPTASVEDIYNVKHRELHETLGKWTLKKI